MFGRVAEKLVAQELAAEKAIEERRLLICATEF
jgi:hypothetical protein